MKCRNLISVTILTFIILGICAYCFSPARGSEYIIGTADDAPVNLVATTIGEGLVVVSGMAGDDPVNVVSHTEGRLVARIQWTGTIADHPVEPAKTIILEEPTDPEEGR
jgi:hypothetical protein